MRISLALVALGAAALATPALAQVNLGLGGQAGAGLAVNAGGTVGGVTDALRTTVNRLDRTVNGTLGSDARLATAADLETGAVVRDRRGNSIGVLQAVHGNAVMVVKNGNMLHVPLSALYRGAAGLVANLSKAELKAMASTNAGAHARD